MELLGPMGMMLFYSCAGMHGESFEVVVPPYQEDREPIFKFKRTEFDTVCDGGICTFLNFLVLILLFHG